MFGEQLGGEATPVDDVVRVLICDEHVLARRSLIASLEESGVVEVVAEATSGAEAVTDARHFAPDIAFVSLVLPDLAGVEVIRLIADVMPGVGMVALSVEESTDERLEALRAGATAVIDKERILGEGDAAVERILHREPTIDPATAVALLDCFDDLVAGSGLAPLATRERVVLAALAAGTELADVAGDLDQSAGEARNHLLNVCFRLQRGAPIEPTVDDEPLLAKLGS